MPLSPRPHWRQWSSGCLQRCCPPGSLRPPRSRPGSRCPHCHSAAGRKHGRNQAYRVSNEGKGGEADVLTVTRLQGGMRRIGSARGGKGRCLPWTTQGGLADFQVQVFLRRGLAHQGEGCDAWSGRLGAEGQPGAGSTRGAQVQVPLGALSLRARGRQGSVREPRELCASCPEPAERGGVGEGRRARQFSVGFSSAPACGGNPLEEAGCLGTEGLAAACTAKCFSVGLAHLPAAPRHIWYIL